MPGLINGETQAPPENGEKLNGHDIRSSAASDDVPVLVVGGGPTGLLLAFLLSKFGIRSLLIEKYSSRLAAPKAHALNPRSLEICRQYGLDTKAIRSLGTQREDAFWVNFLTNLSGELIGVLPYERMDAEVLNDTPEMIHNIPQPRFEQFVAEHLINDPNVEIRKDVAYISSVQKRDEVITTVEDRATKSRYQIRSRHVIGCDGARSEVRKSLGVECEGEDSYETMMTIHFNADLRPVVKDRVGMLHWIMDPACSGFIIGYDLSGNQVLISNFDPDLNPLESWNEELARSVVSKAIGQDIPFDVLSFRPWVLSRKVANQYRVGNVFLAGDAAHAFPPTGGLGLNTGIADVHNLAYKLAALHQGWASDRLLDLYELERRPMAMINARQSVKNGKEIFSFLKALGVAGIKDVNEARQNLLRTIHDPTKQQMIANYVEGQREHFDNLELHIGYVYGSKEIPAHASHYTPKFVPGARLPHAWIKFQPDLQPSVPPEDVSYVSEFLPAEVDLRQYSTLDLCEYNAFTLLVESKEEWADRYSAVARSLERKPFKFRVFGVNSDFSFIDPKYYTLFSVQGGLGSGKALLIRPDQHILAKLNADDTADTIQEIVRGHLGL